MAQPIYQGCMYGRNSQNSSRSRLGLPLGKELILLLNRHGAMSATTPLLFRGIGSIANTASVTKDCSTARSENICRMISEPVAKRLARAPANSSMLVPAGLFFCRVLSSVALRHFRGGFALFQAWPPPARPSSCFLTVLSVAPKANRLVRAGLQPISQAPRTSGAGGPLAFHAHAPFARHSRP